MTAGRSDGLAQAVAHHQGGRLAEAESIYCAILHAEPSRDDVMHLLGVLLHQRGESNRGIELIYRAIGLNPSVALYHLNLGSALAQMSRVEEAIEATQRALTISPNDAQAFFNLGGMLELLERNEEAVAAYRQALSIRPDFAAACNNLGNALRNLGRLAEAEASYRRSLQFRLNDNKTRKNLAKSLHDQGRLPEAAAEYNNVIGLDPRDADAFTDLGMVLASDRRFDEAIDKNRHALSVDPSHIRAMGNLGNALKDNGLLDEAINFFRRALALDRAQATPDAGCLTASRDSAGASPNSPSRATAAHLNETTLAIADSLLVAIHLHPDYDPRRIAEEHKWWEQTFALPSAPQARAFPNHPDPGRRLRVGYISPQLGDQIVGHCLWPLLGNHDHAEFEIFCYSNARRGDWMTERFRKAADAWRDVAGISDERLAAMIRQDQIDILVDLTMHMDGNRLLTFARKPAPVQLTWIGYPSTTGLGAIDYRLSDQYLDPPAPDGSHEQFYSERTIRLPNSYWCYAPLEDLPPPGELPAISNRAITFGCLNNFCKVTDQTISLWAPVLRNVEGSRLRILAPQGSARDRVLGQFRGHGIDPGRIGFLDRRPRRQYMELYQQLDIGLDSFPYNGHTTTLDSLWMGVPVVTMTGSTAVSRGGLSILSNVGLGDFCASTPVEFVQIASRLAADRGRLASLRSTLRERMNSSPLTDGPRFARDMEATYRCTWCEWCQSTAATSPDPTPSTF